MSSFFHKNWGYYTFLVEDDIYKIKKLYIYPGALMSLQRHFSRSEYWIVIKGSLYFFNDNGFVKVLHPGDSVFINRGDWHSVSNESLDTSEVIEIWFGDILKENDIERLTESCKVGDKNYELYSKIVGRSC